MPRKIKINYYKESIGKNQDGSKNYMQLLQETKVCKLTKKQDKAWVFAFGHYKDKGYSDAKADKSAFRDLIQEFPRLKGCKKIR